VSFYQTTSALFVGLLVAVLLRTELIEGDQSQVQDATNRGRRRAALIALASIVMAIGEIVSLLVLFSAHSSRATHLIVGITAVVAVLGSLPPALMTVVGRVVDIRAVRLPLRKIAWTSTVSLGIGALWLAHHLGAFTAGPVPPGSLNIPRFYRVYGTCAAGACGLNERSAPTPHARKLGQLQDGASIGVICQTRGYRLRTDGHASRIWDQLVNAAYVSDLFVSTPDVGSFSPELKRCPDRPITNGTQG
jgi:MFS family permease